MYIIYVLIRILLLLAILGLVAFIVKKYSLSKNKRIAVGIAAFLLYTILTNVPFENVFVNFSSTESVFNYTQNGEILQIAEGKESSAVVYEVSSSKYSTMYTIKNSKGYKICPTYFAKDVAENDMFSNDVSIEIVNIKGTDDYYMSFFGMLDKEVVISDNTGKIFDPVYMDVSNKSNKKLIEGIVAIDYTSDYCVYIDGVPTTLIPSN